MIRGLRLRRHLGGRVHAYVAQQVAQQLAQPGLVGPLEQCTLGSDGDRAFGLLHPQILGGPTGRPGRS